MQNKIGHLSLSKGAAAAPPCPFHHWLTAPNIGDLIIKETQRRERDKHPSSSFDGKRPQSQGRLFPIARFSAAAVHSPTNKQWQFGDWRRPVDERSRLPNSPAFVVVLWWTRQGGAMRKMGGGQNRPLAPSSFSGGCRLVSGWSVGLLRKQQAMRDGDTQSRRSTSQGEWWVTGGRKWKIFPGVDCFS